MADGFQGSGYIDANGNWVDTPGTTLNTPDPRVINTPNSSTGEPAYADPSAPRFAPEFATPQGGALTTTTPNSRTGAPAPGIRNLPAETPNLGRGQPYVQNLIRTMGRGYVLDNIATIAERANLPLAVAMSLVTPTDQLASPKQDEAPRWSWPVLPGSVEPYSNPRPVTQTEPSPRAAIPVTSGGGGPIGPGPEGRGPGLPMGPLAAIPPNSPSAPNNVPYPPPRPKDTSPTATGGGGGRGGGGRSAPGPAPPMMNLQPQPGWTTIDRPNADVAGGPSRAGQLAPQYFNRAREPGGPAQMGVFDLSSLWRQPAAPQPAAAAPAAAARAPVRGPLASGALNRPAQGGGMSRVDPNMGPMQGGSPFPSQMGPFRNPGPMDPSIIAHARARGIDPTQLLAGSGYAGGL